MRPPSVPLLLALPTTIQAFSFQSAPQANLDLSRLGRVAVAGDFSGISLYEFEQQTEEPFRNNGVESLLARMPNGAFASILDTDASVLAMCPLKGSDGKVTSVVVGGNFTSLGQKEAQGFAVIDPNTSEVTPVSGLSGQVNALFCEEGTNTVYLGGNFAALNSTNAIKWEQGTGFAGFPFAGFNGPVTSITKAASGNHIIFGGSFTGLGNTSLPTTPDGQVINLSTAQITADQTTDTVGFNDPTNIVCKTSSQDGAGNTWLLTDNSPGVWRAKFNFGFRPTKLRLRNTHQDGRGTKTWRFTALPINGIMNFTYIDPASGTNQTCTSTCPLSDDKFVEFQDFHFVNVIGMNEFRIDISDWYGNGGGLDGVELFQDDIFTHAINDFNEPACAANVTFKSSATATGPWTVTPSANSNSDYLSAVIPVPVVESAAQIVFTPDIRESGSYFVNLYTPGCVQDGTCASRGQFHITGKMTASGTNETSISQTLFQTNDFDKYDQIYSGEIDATSDSFKPTITMTPVAGQVFSGDRMTFVAQKIGLTMVNSTGGLVGLYEFDPTTTRVDTADFATSVFNKLGTTFSRGSAVNTLATGDNAVFIGGNFTTNDVTNIVSVQDGASKSLNGGLNGEVLSMILNGTSLFVGGRFNSTADKSASALGNVAIYDTAKNSWSAVGGGVNGRVNKIVPLTMNITSSTPEIVISVNGDFTSLNSFGNNTAVPATGFGVWVPSQNNWLPNLQLSVEALNGILSAAILDVGDGSSLYSGSVSSSTLGVNGAATLGSSLGRFPVNIQGDQTSLTSSSLSKRDTLAGDASSISGVVTGTFDTNGRNLTVLAGHFAAATASGSTINNLLFLDGPDNKNEVSGLGSEVSTDSTFTTLAVLGNTLWAGGNVTATIGSTTRRGFILYDLANKALSSSQPPSLQGGNMTVSAIAVRPSSGDVYVGGDFQSAGSLPCPGVCFFSTSASQWLQPGSNLEGTANTMMWTTSSTLVAGGNLKVNDLTTSYLVKFDAAKQVWDSYPGAEQLPGPVEVITSAARDNSQLWVAGVSTDGTPYIMKYDGSKWASPDVKLQTGSSVRGLQVFSLTQAHGGTELIDASQALMLTGSLVLPIGDGFSASAALFNGSAFEPYALTTNAGNTAGSIARVFVEKNDFFSSNEHHLPLVFIVLIGLGISLALMLIIVVGGLFLDRWRKRREGYVPAPTFMHDRGSGMQRIPPGELLESLNQGRPGAPQV